MSKLRGRRRGLQQNCLGALRGMAPGIQVDHAVFVERANGEKSAVDLPSVLRTYRRWPSNIGSVGWLRRPLFPSRVGGNLCGLHGRREDSSRAHSRTATDYLLVPNAS